MKTKAIIVILLSLLVMTSFGQSVNETLYQAYLQRSQSLWKKALEQSKKEKTTELNLCLVYYSMLSGSMATQDEEFFDEYVGEAKKLLQNFVDKNPTSGEAAAMLAGIYGFEIGYSPFKGMLLGGKSSSLSKKATSLEPNSALVWKLYGNNKYYTPSAFGGDIKEAIQALEKSISLFESDPASLKNNWLYIDTITTLGQAYQKNNDPTKAIATYEKALLVEPNFGYAKKLLEKVRAQKM